MPQLILQEGSDPNLALTNTFAVFILGIITWVGSTITNRGVTFIKEIKLKVLKVSG